MPVRVVPLELLGHGDEFLDVLGPGLVLRVAAGAQRFEEADLLEHVGEDLGHRGGGRLQRRLVEDGREPQNGSGHFRAEAELVGLTHRLTQGLLVLIGVVLQCGFGGGADAALRSVHDAAQGDRVERVRDGREVGHHILDLGAFVELGSAEHPVRAGRIG